MNMSCLCHNEEENNHLAINYNLYLNELIVINVAAGELIWTVVDKEWQYGDVPCKLFKFFQTFGLTSSTYLVVAIALDRVWAIVTPLTRSVGTIRHHRNSESYCFQIILN